MKRYIFLSVTIALLSIGCTDRDDDINAVHIRIKNASSRTYDTVQVGDVGMSHSNIAAGEYSAYLEYEKAYSYAYIKIDAADENFVLQPNDFVGETPLTIGFYTYELGIDQDGNVTLNFVVD